MKVAFSSKAENMEALIDPRFGRADFLVSYDEESGDVSHYDNRSIEGVAHGAGPKTAQKLGEIGAKVLITGNGPGGNAQTILEKNGIAVFVGAEGMTLSEAYDAYKRNELEEAT